MTITGLQGVLGQPGSTILVENGVFNMYGGKISGNTKDSAIPIAGTIVYYNPGVANITAEINLYGGEITGNTQKHSTSAYYAGAVMVIVAGNPAGSSAAFRMTGGTIADNDSSTRGKAGGVHLYGSAVAVQSPADRLIVIQPMRAAPSTLGMEQRLISREAAAQAIKR